MKNKLTNRQIHDYAEPHYGKCKRIGYSVSWAYDTTRVKGQATTFANGTRGKYETDCAGYLPLTIARTLAKRIAAAEEHGFFDVRIYRVTDVNRGTEDGRFSETYGAWLADTERWSVVPAVQSEVQPAATAVIHNSYKPMVKVTGEDTWHANGLRFTTYDEALSNAKDLMSRWTMAVGISVEESDDAPNYRWTNGRLESI